AIIRHLRDVCSQKREKHSMSANFIIFSEKCDIAQKARKSIRQESCELNRDSEITFNKEQRQELYKAYRLVNSTRSFFAFKKYMVADRVIYKYEGLFDFSKDKMLIDEQMLEICYDFETVGFSVEEGKNCIRVYHNATHLFDYYLNESSGDWKLRSRGEIERFVQEFLKGRMVEQFASTIIDLAYKGIGSMIIITDSIEKFEKDKKSSQIVNIKLTEELLKGQFFDFASDDGAVVINRESEKDLKLYSYGVFINPICDLDEEYNKYIQQTHSGTRHEKAARYACENPNDYVFIISDNKTISFLHGKEIIFWRDKLIKDGGKA
ncbi:diadenylate cyclase, partial [bacterium]|nr:diadenylate cyclase [bacterium]